MKKLLAIALGVSVVSGYALWRGPARGAEPSQERESLRAPAGGIEPPAEREHEPHGRHPITPERERLQRELQLVGALNDAVDLNDVNAMRRLIELYREHDPSDEHKLQQGYARIADCLQEPGSESRARAQHYYDTERASTLRRYVRRACFDR